eukprot:TRINITY_DN5924_c0_g1_i1.p1 TRINITY_DN5924_c0_g1~~TRINITY_DN5924_c0_g1_i1.p1  ORF type:complete len:317 (+),score=67.42 TRINITY_DN5924_c0_g1_i1:42-953(+)
MTAVIVAKQAIDDALAAEKISSLTELNEALETFRKMEVSAAIIKETGVGKTIAKLAKASGVFADLAVVAKEIMKQWRTEVAKEKSGKRKRESLTPSTEPPSKIRKLEVGGEVKGEEVAEESTEKRETVYVALKPFKPNTGTTMRDTIQSRFQSIFTDCDQSISDAKSPEELAVSIEEALNAKFESKAYQAKFRTLYLNLKDPLNRGLRNALYSGQLPVERLVQMDHTELANPQVQSSRKKTETFMNESRMEDAKRKSGASNLFTCNKCGKNKTSYFQMQTRSADEPITTFVTCLNCGKSWRFG